MALERLVAFVERVVMLSQVTHPIERLVTLGAFKRSDGSRAAVIGHNGNGTRFDGYSVGFNRWHHHVDG